jgi:hypothetical protein
VGSTDFIASEQRIGPLSTFSNIATFVGNFSEASHCEKVRTLENKVLLHQKVKKESALGLW